MKKQLICCRLNLIHILLRIWQMRKARVRSMERMREGDTEQIANGLNGINVTVSELFIFFPLATENMNKTQHICNLVEVRRFVQLTSASWGRFQMNWHLHNDMFIQMFDSVLRQCCATGLMIAIIIWNVPICLRFLFSYSSRSMRKQKEKP